MRREYTNAEVGFILEKFDKLGPNRQRQLICEFMVDAERLNDCMRLRPAESWHEDDGNVVWWRIPVEEAPYVGTPNDSDWPGDGIYTHWTPLLLPDERTA